MHLLFIYVLYYTRDYYHEIIINNLNINSKTLTAQIIQVNNQA